MAKRTPAFKAQKVKMSAGDYVFAIIDYLVFGIFTAACIFPFYYLIINTISNNKLVAAGKINFWPVGFHLDNYANIFKLNDLGNAFVVTLSRTIIGTALMVFGSALCGYLFTRNVAQEVLVPLRYRHDVPECRYHPVVLEHEHAGSHK